ncbi:hypothetical protein PUN28_015162 [Cardiocondyla obscurior]|uniref:Secreted protein n=1 Tax=Cardiocondyla obscurior TaxID=286306 RepID=A0AAW2F109_9HYME
MHQYALRIFFFFFFSPVRTSLKFRSFRNSHANARRRISGRVYSLCGVPNLSECKCHGGPGKYLGQQMLDH